MLRRLHAVAEHTEVPSGVLNRTDDFIRRVFAEYGHAAEPQKKYGFVFAVPTRIQRASERYMSEAKFFVPIVEYLDKEMRQLFISGLPPAVIDEYHNKDGRAVGAVLFVPLFSDMLHDYRSKLMLKLAVNRVIRDTATFAHHRLGADIVGLGASLPKLTGFGAMLRSRGLLTTTGHGGTVYLILKSVEYFLRRGHTDLGVPIGIVGCGAIGEASASLLLEKYPDITVIVHDKREGYQRKIVAAMRRRYGERAKGARTNDEVLRAASIIISAVTSRITVGQGVDLSGKIIIDDSQPGSFSGPEVRRHGGQLVWVVGHDDTQNKILTRKSNYRFGDTGLADQGDVWGCEAEVATLWMRQRFDLAIDEAVTPISAISVGVEMDDVGISLAAWQEHGRHVTINHPS